MPVLGLDGARASGKDLPGLLLQHGGTATSHLCPPEHSSEPSPSLTLGEQSWLCPGDLSTRFGWGLDSGSWELLNSCFVFTAVLLTLSHRAQLPKYSIQQ